MKHPFFPLAILAVALTACGQAPESTQTTEQAAPAETPAATMAEKPEATTSEKIDKAAEATKEAAIAVKDDVVKATSEMVEKLKSDERVEKATEKAASMIDKAKVAAADMAVATGIVDDPMVSHTTRAVAGIKKFARTLQGELKAAMSAGGAPNAIQVCNEKAGGIASDISAETGYNLGRVSLKNRNPDQAASGWNKTVLEEFEARLANGEPIDKLVFKTIVTREDGSQEFRMMKAIPTGKVCLNCHGSEIKDEVTSKLDELYPDDNARGYKEGDIRGAFVVTKTL
ncbi:Tll0287-like domain-containing protein [Solemya velum gill symbiont]|uniref:Tll0287-like domain-containing protein n=1 Tax=Solemya velum gill symbiont TaxID=2340 RepID=UPI0009970A58|nr:DUF3365 domain-containing protein [Solemya velum gill symbiont]